ncbi:AraC-type DNA-binding protein [Robiginitalea myxolifaciens]|uniref:AraC-type DNA-binding protein n=1 Tax=Robiginitalea myxolifaciens TaxID=400055 RepID=A0A1I6HKQ0_9FLAO|nr:AraC family transcriptional regulator [Robiginitalea myxolifaciens]SFR55053.1 AraC-type DNA-binding protein [Robiginitalea myxolifaciens]
MIFETHTIKTPLVDYIESIFYHSGFKPDHSIERVVPTGHLFIIMALDGFTYHTFNKETLQPNGTYCDVWVSGMHKNYLSISAHQDAEMLVIQFKTKGAYPFLKIPIHELNDKVIPAQDVFGNEILELRKMVLKAKGSAMKFGLVEKWLLCRFEGHKSAPSELVAILEQLRSQPISESKEIVASFTNSQKHLIHEFKKYFGLTPKVFHRVFRFNQIVSQIQNKEPLKWTDIAYEFGYSDQSHFIREFKEFSGFNPQEFIKADFHRDEPNFFPLDRHG